MHSCPTGCLAALCITLFGLCPALVSGWDLSIVQHPNGAGAGEKPRLSDACGQSAFNAASSNVCRGEMRFDMMFPVGILWVNCKFAATGSSDMMITCGRTDAGKLVDNKHLLTECVQSLPHRKFMTLLEYTLLAFEACEDIANGHVVGEVRAAVDELLREASKSGAAQKRLREEIELLILSSRGVIEESARFEDVQKSTRKLERMSKTTARLVEDTLGKAAEASLTITARYKSLSKRMANNLQEAATASEEMRGMVRETISHLDDVADLRVTAAQWDTYKIILACALVGIVVVSGTTTVAEIWPVATRLMCTSVSAFALSFSHLQLFGSNQLVCTCIVATSFAILASRDIYLSTKFISHYFRTVIRGREDAQSVSVQVHEDDNSSKGSVEAHSFQDNTTAVVGKKKDALSISESNTRSFVKAAPDFSLHEGKSSKCSD